MSEPKQIIPVRHPHGGDMFAAWVPLPAYDGTQHCVGAEMYAPDHDLYDNNNDAIQGTVAFYKYAAKLCTGCPFQTACAEYGIAHETDGMWGGLSPRQRRHIRSRRRWMVTSPDEIPARFSDAGSQLDTEEGAA